MEALTHQEYQDRREQVLNRFTPEFVSTYLCKDPTFQQVYEALIRGMEPYQVIEILLEGRQVMLDRMTEITRSWSPPRIVRQREDGGFPSLPEPDPTCYP